MYGIKWYRQAGVRMYLIEIVTSVNSSTVITTPLLSLLQLRVPAEYRTPPEPGSYQSSPDSHPARTKARTRLVSE